MHESNGVDRNAHGPMAGWAIVVSNAKQMIGRIGEATTKGVIGGGEPLSFNRFVLKPVYEFNVQAGPNGQGGVQINFSAVPMFLIASIDSVTVPDGALVIRCETMSRSEQGRLLAAVNNAEQLQMQLRTADAGISLATEMPRVPAGGTRRAG